MLRHAPYQWNFLLGAALTLLAPALAGATCGDYVHVGSENTARETVPAIPLTPCHGPECSQRDVPVAPPMSSAPVLTPGDDWCSPLSALVPQPTPRGGRIVLDDVAACNGHARDIFHPPR